MRLLLDLVGFLRAGSVPERLPDVALASLIDPSTERYIAASTIWEMAIKVSLGKLDLRLPLAEELSAQFDALNLVEIPIARRHALRVAELPMHHRDPFDRMLVAVALEEGLTIVTNDPLVARYDVTTLW